MALRPTLAASPWTTSATRATPNSTPTNASLKVAVAIDAAMTSMMNPISSGSLIGVRNRTIESAPRRPSDSGSENWMQTKMAVIDSPSSGNARYTWLPVARDE